MTATTRTEINRQNATHSTGPKTEAGKQASSMNAFRHGLTGNHMLLQPHEQEAHTRLTSALTREYSPATESESQFVRKIIDCHIRLNRIVAIENNILNIGVTRHTNPDSAHDASTEAMIAQAAAWIADANTFDKLSRYEGRISRQLLQYTKELDRIQTARREARAQREAERRPITQTEQTKPNTPKSASFRQTPLIQNVPHIIQKKSVPKPCQSVTTPDLY